MSKLSRVTLLPHRSAPGEREFRQEEAQHWSGDGPTTATQKAAHGNLGSVREQSTACVLIHKCSLLSRKRTPQLPLVGQPPSAELSRPDSHGGSRISRALCVCATLSNLSARRSAASHTRS